MQTPPLSHFCPKHSTFSGGGRRDGVISLNRQMGGRALCGAPGVLFLRCCLLPLTVEESEPSLPAGGCFQRMVGPGASRRTPLTMSAL